MYVGFITLNSGITEINSLEKIEDIWFDAEDNLILAKEYGNNCAFKTNTLFFTS